MLWRKGISLKSNLQALTNTTSPPVLYFFFTGLSRFLLGFTNEEFQHSLQVQKHSQRMQMQPKLRVIALVALAISPPLAGFQVSDFDPALLQTSHDS